LAGKPAGGANDNAGLQAKAVGEGLRPGARYQTSQLPSRGRNDSLTQNRSGQANSSRQQTGLYNAAPGVVGLKPGKTGNLAWDRLTPDQKSVYTGGWGMQNPSGGLSSVVDWGQDDRFGAGGQVSTGVQRFNPNWSNQSAPVSSLTSASARDGYFSNGVPQRSASMSPIDNSWNTARRDNQARMHNYQSHNGVWTAQPLR
jgi:hypothetical protein